MAERETETNAIQIKQLLGLNERASIANLPKGVWDKLEGLYPARSGSLERIPGKSVLSPGTGAVLAIHQTFDSRNNIIIQTTENIQVITLDALLSSAPVTTITPTPLLGEEDMSYALIVHRQLAYVEGGGTLTTYSQRPLTDIIASGINPDGTTTAFCTFAAANQFQLTAGTYRVKIKCAFGGAETDRATFRLYNVTAAANAFAGLFTNCTTVQFPVQLGGFVVTNTWGDLQGWFTITAPNTFEIQDKAEAANPVNGRGDTGTASGVALTEPEIFTVVEILKTA